MSNLYEDIKRDIENLKNKKFEGNGIDIIISKDYWNKLCSIAMGQAGREEKLIKQLAEKDKEIAEYEQQSNYAYNISRLQKLLKDKDKEIAELEEFNAKSVYDSIEHALKMQKKQQRHEICEKIRAFIKAYRTQDSNNVYTINVDDELLIDDNLLKKLDQIERGDE